MPAKISRKVGGKWSAFGGMILGKNLALVPNRMIVQSWRSRPGKRPILIPSWSSVLRKSKGGATVHLAHVGVPPYDHKGVTKGWKKYYWEPWKKYFAQDVRNRKKWNRGLSQRGSTRRPPDERSRIGRRVGRPSQSIRSRGRISRLRSMATRSDGRPRCASRPDTRRPDGYLARFTIHYDLNCCRHFVTGAGTGPAGLAFRRNRNSP